MKGTYCLFINIDKDIKIKIGKVLGKIDFKKGCYLYVGSAMNSLEARVQRHLNNNKKKHWHVDYILLNESSNVENVIINVSDKKIECDLAQLISENEKIIHNFGCSDCNCESHLIYFENYDKAYEKVTNAFQKLNLDFSHFQ